MSDTLQEMSQKIVGACDKKYFGAISLKNAYSLDTLTVFHIPNHIELCISTRTRGKKKFCTIRRHKRGTRRNL